MNASLNGKAFRGSIVVIGLLLGAVSGWGEDGADPPTTLTLREALNMALADNHGLRASRAQADAAGEEALVARSHLLPRVVFEERYLRTDNPGYVFSSKINQGLFMPEDLGGAPATFNHPETLDDFETSISLEQPLYAPAALKGREISNAGARAALLAHERAREETAFRVFEAFENLKSAKAFREAAETARRDVDEHLRIARARRDAGLGLDSDVLQLEAAAAMARSRLIQADNRVELARRSLGLVVGAGGPVGIREDDLPLELPPAGDDGEALLLSRPDLLAMGQRVRQAELGVRMAGAAMYPTLGVFASGQWNDPDNPFGDAGDSFRAGAVLRWDLFSGFGDQARVAKARRELEGAREAEKALLQFARFGMEEARLRLREAAAMMDAARQSVEASEEGVRLVRLRFENGLAPVVSLISAQAGLDAARAEEIRARAQHRISQGAVHYQQGTLLACLLGQP